MFTGLVDDVGTITAVEVTDAGREFRVHTAYESLALGESVACDGVCLTVRTAGPLPDGEDTPIGSAGAQSRPAGASTPRSWFTVAAVGTTLGRTALGTWQAGRRINLERALRAGDRLGGHLVQGHVDGVGLIERVVRRGDAWLLDVRLPEELDALIVPHGSITVDGVSLTVNALPAPGVLQLSIIEYTHRHTTLGLRTAGDQVHLEADVIGKYVQRLVAPYLAAAPASTGARGSGPTVRAA